MNTLTLGRRGRVFFASYLVMMRPYLLFVSGITGIAGMSFASGFTPGQGLLLGMAAFLSYGFGQALTDCFQVDTDRLSSPYRPLVRGVISKPLVLAVSVAGLIVCVAVFALFEPWNLLLGLVAASGLVTYTFFKRRWWGGPWYNAWIVGVLFLMGYLGGGGIIGRVTPSLLWALAAVVAGYANFVLAGYFKDTTADAQTGYNTLPVVFGRQAASWISHCLAVAAFCSAVLAVHQTLPAGIVSLPGIPPGLFLFAALVLGLTAQVRLTQVRNDHEAHGPIALVVHTYILCLAAITTARRPAWTLSLFLFYVAFMLVLQARPSRTQI